MNPNIGTQYVNYPGQTTGNQGGTDATVQDNRTYNPVNIGGQRQGPLDEIFRNVISNTIPGPIKGII